MLKCSGGLQAKSLFSRDAWRVRRTDCIDNANFGQGSMGRQFLGDVCIMGQNSAVYLHIVTRLLLGQTQYRLLRLN